MVRMIRSSLVIPANMTQDGSISLEYTVGYMTILNIGAQNRGCMEHDEDGPISISPKQWIELFKMMPTIGKAYMTVSLLIILGVIGYVLVG